MFLKSLTLKGFKSFADKTTLELEPGVTVVVGPNGSGKSNLVDAVAWVLGAQGPRTLRGGKMDDVIFAGTPQRPALGRAEVSLTIDNTAGLLPIEFNEVTITRTLFRTGDSEYQINGAPCRLLDIQELLSDTGIGRQQHVIVGQGQLDTVLNARPEDRRAIIEEAAGVLKYRKRRERAERRLEATEGNMLRLQDLLREVRRQLTPLQRQADAARRHGGVVEELRSIRLHLAGHELAGLQARLERLHDTKAELGRSDAALRGRLRDLDVAVLDAERAITALGDQDLAESLVRVESVRERGRGLRALIGEKQRGVERELAAAADEGVVETLVADAAAARSELQAVDADALAREVAEVERVERAVEEQRARFDEQFPAGAGGGVDELTAVRRELAARREALARAENELARDDTRAASLRERIERLTAERSSLRDDLVRAESRAPGLDDTATAAVHARVEAEDRLRVAEEEWRFAEGDAGRWRARAEALGLALETARAKAGAQRLVDVDGVAGPLVDHLEIEPGLEPAVVSALGDAMQAVVVQGGQAARAALARLKEGDTEALLLVTGSAGVTVQGELVPPGTRPLAACVHAKLPGLEATLSHFLSGVVLVEAGWRTALDLALTNPGLVCVTPEGDRFGGRALWRAGGGSTGGVTQAALDEAMEQAARADATRAAAEARVHAARERLEQSQKAESATDHDRRENEEHLSLSSRSLERNEHDRAERGAELEALLAEQAALRAQHDQDLARVAQLDARLPELEQRELDAAAREHARLDALAELEHAADAARALRRDVEVRAAGLEERRAVLTRRLREVEERLARNPEAQAAAERHRAGLMHKAGALTATATRLAEHLTRVDAIHDRLREQRRVQSEAARESTVKLDGLRTERAALEKDLSELRERQQRREVEDAETRLRLEAAVEKLRADFDCEPAAALDAPAPEVPDGTTLAGRARELDRELRIMGPINPLALEEYDALQERHEFLQSQLDDVKQSRRELSRVIRAVDQEIVTVFAAAFDDVQRNFHDLFTTLFPGGSGRVFLTNPDDLLDTGVEIEARPSGKNVRRLSLLSGGERSLTALAYLFAVFRARPSPFYLMDEVEAALDDVNLHRFLDLIHEFRDEAQLLVVSHQKRTMEAADCLYGVTMPPGGSSRVVSQRVRPEGYDDEPEDALVLP
ncbi:MAG: chromosome segregation protein SMC [Acidimicrobiia bacterium]